MEFKKQRVVVKVGTSTITHPSGAPNLRNIEILARTLSDLQDMGHEMILVSSGAIAVGTDKLGLAENGMPMFSRGYKPSSPSKIGPGAINTEVECGKVSVKPGDLIVADADGIVCVPRNLIADVLTKAEEKIAYEAKRVEAIANYRKCKVEGKELPDLTPGWVRDMLK